jgi:hypothetical protein
MTCRLYIDEVGNDDVKTPSERFLSITGITTKVRSHDNLITPEIEQIKADLFGHHPGNNPVILHRKEIIRKEAPFHALQDVAINAQWESRILDLIERLPYIANTVLIDKHEHVNRYQVWHFNPYHYCMRALVERYVLWLNRHHLTGDVVAEPLNQDTRKSLKP